MHILGIQIDNLTRLELREKLRSFLTTRGNLIVTPNPEMLVAAKHNATLQTVLNHASLSICDGFGIVLMSGARLRRIPGVTVMHELFSLAADKEQSVYILWGSMDEREHEQLRNELLQLYPTLRLARAAEGPSLAVCKNDADQKELCYNQEQHTDIVADIIEAAPDILIVGFGHEKQELWLYEQLPELPSVKIAAGFGGALDYLAKKKKRAPRFMRALGLEWLYRLIQEPARISRIITAVIIFPYYCLRYGHRE